LTALPALGVVDHFDQFSGAADTALIAGPPGGRRAPVSRESGARPAD